MVDPRLEDELVVIRKSTREAPTAREATLQTILDMLFDGVLIIHDGVVVETNDALHSMTGYKGSELKGVHLEDLEEWRGMARALARVSAEPVSFESVIPRKGSGTTSATVGARRITTSNQEIVIAVVAGMTENEPVSASLQRSAERYRALFGTIPDLVFIKDQRLRFVEVNPAVERTLGISASEIIGRTAEQILVEQDAGRVHVWDSRVLSGDTIEAEHTLTVQGKRVILHMVRAPIRNNTGEVVGICGIGRDVTERRSATGKTGIDSSPYVSKVMKETMELARQAAASDSIVLLLGESGSGKDHVAQWIHEHSKRSGSPFLTINCAAVPRDLAESELFGYEAGAFSGATNRKRGLLELAEGGTLLLNEIGELSLFLQSKLLAFLDSRSFLRLGGQRSVKVDARILAASHRDLEAAVAANQFSRPLFYRLNVLPIRVPPLRDRLDDIPELARELIAKLAQDMNLPRIPSLDAGSLKSLVGHNWPGNIRELRNVLERSLISWQGGKLEIGWPLTGTEKEEWSHNIVFEPGRKLRDLSREFQRLVCVEAIRRSRGNHAAAAKSLGVSRDSLYRHLKEGGGS